MNYFELFELPFRASIDNTHVVKKYMDLQKKYHPDFFTLENEAEKEEAEKKSADINKAYTIFKDKDKTLEYFLQQKDIVTTDEKYQLPPDFLMEIMDINEAVTEDNRETVNRLIDSLSHQLEDGVQEIFLKNEQSEYSADELNRLKEYFYKKKYLKRILDRLSD
ncbi:MAG: Fe-S protein assembly co-chaperone HscB [Niastella sp.]|nr:Fe-S protein assembly co-chaperone HscB [Niastella sp.]